MGACDVAGDGQPQPGPAALQIAPLIQAMKGTEDFFALQFGDSGAVILHRDLHQMVIPAQTHGHLGAVLEGIVDQIGQYRAAARRA